MLTKKTSLSMALSSLTLALATAAHSAPPSRSDLLNEFWSPDRLHPLECRFGVLNNSPWGLPRCMQAKNVMTHLQMLNDIAGANDGTRAAGLPGYDASVDYIKSTLESAGYNVTLAPFPFNAFYPQGPGTLESTAPDTTSYEWEVDFSYLSQTDAGDVTGPVAAVDLALGPDNGSTSGCEAEDFAGFPAGSIALVQRGSCTFQIKAENAAAAGAIGVIIFNQGNTDDRKGLMNATLGDDYTGGIPVVFATYDNGVAWSGTEGLQMHVVTDVVRKQTETVNVIAESRRGNPDNVVMVGSHLDSVYEGAGINDNGSGSAALLEMALQMRRAHPRNKIRFAWWGAEESGLVGSTHYVQNLPEDELKKIKVYLNFDMIASPNFAYMIYDGDGSDFGLEGPPGSKATEKLFEDYYKLRALPYEGTEISFRSDYAQFFTDGVAFGGLFTGAEVAKTEEQAEKYGGDAGVALDHCYHQACDDINNIAQDALEINIDAVAFVTSWLSLSTKVIDDEIEAAAKKDEGVAAMRAFSASSSSSASSYDITHWGKHWIK
ncbi:M28 family peptidase [Hahella sp. KA22]|uniref:M28 family metallopeptidase n=1 Tax=Hahella sp. KA22 TaxID=1628392 RepID=UPI000FDE861D|nr:M28 family metallopeptidase [Hahella sp. KA22]AZZ93850.1 M28 family peptidase [Hahella sp. KA22]QAY57223.1 M28 family peptidase [Hahella sp. KA22]